MIYCAYSGCGKTTYCKKHPDTTFDLDSSSFKKEENWEVVYVSIARILSESGKNVFISAHQVVIKYLIANKIDFELILPSHEKEIWSKRLGLRWEMTRTQGNWNAFVDCNENFEKDMKFYESCDCVKHYVEAHIVTNIEEILN